MGILRILLAISVVLYHTAPLFGIRLLENHLAIQAFFIVSGFYMALVLNEKYIGRNKSYKLFLTNRLLRIMPVYWITLLITFAALAALYFLHMKSSFFEYYFSSFQNLSGLGLVLKVIAEILRNTFFLFTFNFLNPFIKDPNYLVIQSWTLEIELLFYVIAPFIVRRKVIVILGLILLSFISRTLTYNLHIFGLADVDNRFFPNQLIFFLLGALSYKLYVSTQQYYKKEYGIILLALVVAVMLFYNNALIAFRILGFNLLSWGFLLLLTISLPFIFTLSNKNRIDRILGELSYPLYMTHLLIVLAITLLGLRDKISITLYPIIVLSISITFSYGIFRVVENKIDSYRQKRLKTT